MLLYFWFFLNKWIYSRLIIVTSWKAKIPQAPNLEQNLSSKSISLPLKISKYLEIKTLKMFSNKQNKVSFPIKESWGTKGRQDFKETDLIRVSFWTTAYLGPAEIHFHFLSLLEKSVINPNCYCETSWNKLLWISSTWKQSSTDEVRFCKLS